MLSPAGLTVSPLLPEKPQAQSAATLFSLPEGKCCTAEVIYLVTVCVYSRPTRRGGKSRIYFIFLPEKDDDFR
jgi:hypothetical protein